VKNYIQLCCAVAEATRLGGIEGVSAGHLYARLSGFDRLTLDKFYRAVDTLRAARLVAEYHHVLTWIGPTPKIVKVCGCGRQYTFETWKGLPLVGYHTDEVEILEFRNCKCRSTLAISATVIVDPSALADERRAT
jgi:hypothetical protein